MTTRTRKTWKLDSQGQYVRQIGWKRGRNGARVQHKFRLGADLNEARRREQKLREVWEAIERSPPNAVWTPFLLDAAKGIARGETEVVLPREQGETEIAYAQQVKNLETLLPVVRVVPSDVEAYSQGRRQWGDRDRRPIRLSPVRSDFFDDEIVVVGGGPKRRTREQDAASVGKLHQAMRDYITWLKEDFFRPQLGRITDNGQTRIRQVNTLLSRHEDISLVDLDYEMAERMFRYWRQRPPKKDSDSPISAKSASHYIGELRRFFAWLHRSDRYSWRKPEDFDDIDVTVDRDVPGEQKRLVHTPVFTLDELILLNKYATPLERVFLLLGLNCGFGVAEIATLTIGEVHLLQAHSARHQEILNFQSTTRDSFIKRVRRKNRVYGEFLLFEQTVEAIQWLLKRRYTQPNPTPDAPLLLNDRGEMYNKPTKGGNRNQQIPNRFAALRRRIRDDNNEISEHSFGKLRKTAGDLIRRFADGEVSGVFLCHGQPVKTDDLADVYTNRPFGKVFEAIRKVEDYLKPVFEAAGPTPFEPGSQGRTPRRNVARIG
jgi:hypothetical protein